VLGAMALTILVVLVACSTSSPALPTPTPQDDSSSGPTQTTRPEPSTTPGLDQDDEEEPVPAPTNTPPPSEDIDQVEGQPVQEAATSAPTPTLEPDKPQQVFLPDKVSAVDETTNFPSLTDPEFITADQASLSADDLVLGLSMGGESKAYPLRQMWFHHIANDIIGGQPVAVTY